MIAAGAALTDEAGASVTSDTFIRVFMTIRECTGLTAVEWGGAEQHKIS